MNLNSGAHIKYQLLYHVQWVPKYRYRIFQNEIYRYDYETIVRIVAWNHGMEIVEITVMPEHVHAIVSAPPTLSPSKIKQLLKGASSYDFGNLHPEMKLRYPKGRMFSPGAFFRSVGDVDFETTKNYVKNQSIDRYQRIDTMQTHLSKFF
ncbi:MAG: IS200/IS605 family transposase [Candidatus Micrarchaeota archaeon]|nr:IS200/IS605 family transposase [Candidatus Micrarchaeota archaeon]